MDKDNEWYTPTSIIESARLVMGGIDLDPASCAKANETVQAARYYTREENGLLQPWPGRVWCNPPYGRVPGNNATSHQKAFVEKALHEYQRGVSEQILLLTLGNPNSHWFQSLLDYPVCFYRGVLYFTRANGERGRFGFPLAFVYMGGNNSLFCEEFAKYGRIAVLCM